MKKITNQTKGRIVSAAWQLFYQYGYNNTTIDDIVELSQTSKGSFYHYFGSKDDLLGSLSYLFDEKYEELMETMDPMLSPIEKLLKMNQELFLMIENTVSVSMLSSSSAPSLQLRAKSIFSTLTEPTTSSFAASQWRVSSRDSSGRSSR